MNSSDAISRDAKIEIGPKDRYVIEGPRRLRGRPAQLSIAGSIVACLALLVSIPLSGGATLVLAAIATVVIALGEAILLRRRLKFVLTYYFLGLPTGGVHFWPNISSLQLAPDGETLLVWLFARLTVTGERSESDPVRDVPATVSLRGWPYPPADIVAVLNTQFEKHLAQVAIEDQAPAAE